MNRGAAVLLIGGVVLAGGVAFVFARRGVEAPTGAPLPSSVVPPPSPPVQETAGPSTTQQIVGLVAGTAAAVVPAILAPAAVAAAVPTAAGITAGAATVGGSSVAGSVAATQAATAAATQTTPAGAAVAGNVGMSGLAVGLTIGIGAAILVGVLVWRARRNETKEDREDFAESLGFYDETTIFGKKVRNGNVDKLFNDMRAWGTQQGTLDVAGELINRALNVIGKHDRAANTVWMQDVLRFYGVEPITSGYSAAIADAYDREFDDENTETGDQPQELLLA